MLSSYTDNNIDEFYKQHKEANDASKNGQKKSNFISSVFILLLVCYLGRLFLYKNARNICVAICFGFCKNIFILTRIHSHQ